MGEVTTVGLDIGKRVLQVHGADALGRKVLQRKLRREEVAPFFAGLPPCLVGMEACATAHHWGRELRALGPTCASSRPRTSSPTSRARRTTPRTRPRSARP